MFCWTKNVLREKFVKPLHNSVINLQAFECFTDETWFQQDGLAVTLSGSYSELADQIKKEINTIPAEMCLRIFRNFKLSLEECFSSETDSIVNINFKTWHLCVYALWLQLHIITRLQTSQHNTYKSSFQKLPELQQEMYVENDNLVHPYGTPMNYYIIFLNFLCNR